MSEIGSIKINVVERPGAKFSVSVSNARDGRIAALLSSPAYKNRIRSFFSMIYALCPIAHLTAFDRASAAARGLSAEMMYEADRGLADAALKLEALAETIRVLVIEASRIAGVQPSRQACADIGALRAHLVKAARVCLDLNPVERFGAVASGELDAAHDLVKAGAAAAAAAAEKHVFGCPSEEFLEKVTGLETLAAWTVQHHDLPSTALVKHFMNKPRDFGRVSAPFTPTFGPRFEHFLKELEIRLKNEPGFDMAPRWEGSARLTGAVARTYEEPLVDDLRRRFGINSLTLAAARIYDAAACAALLKEYDGRSFDLSAVRTHSSTPGEAVSIASTARGILSHAVKFNDEGELSLLKICSPTEWQFSPEGAASQAAENALRAIRAQCSCLNGQAALEDELRAALFGLDACVPLEFNFYMIGADEKPTACISEEVVRTNRLKMMEQSHA